MIRQLPPLDMHAHIDTSIGRRELEELGAVVFAVCRTTSEFAQVRNRTDQVTIWGVGCHPSIADGYTEFDIAIFRDALRDTPFIGEVGLDRKSAVSQATQERTLTAILELVAETPRLISIHSSGATGQILDLLERSGVRGAILHWWLGSPVQTARAVELGCYFSVNHAMAIKGVVADIPVDRMLVETDHPHGDRRSPSPRQPGSVQAVENLLSDAIHSTADDLRQLQWVNFATLVDDLKVENLMPAAVQRMLAQARSLRK